MGSGSVGSLFGGMAAAKGFSVLLFGREAHINKINESKLLIKGLINHKIKIPSFSSIELLNEFLQEKDSKIQYVLFTTKAHQTETAAKQIRNLINSNVTIVSIQNGIGTEDVLQDI